MRIKNPCDYGENSCIIPQQLTHVGLFHPTLQLCVTPSQGSLPYGNHKINKQKMTKITAA
jgi:hypothetical protein